MRCPHTPYDEYSGCALCLEVERDALLTEVRDWQQRCVNANGEIERLRGALTYTGTALGKAREEIERLRAALKRIAEETAATWVCDVARAALEEAKDTPS